MLGVKVDRQDPTDLYEQVAGEIRRAISEGEAKPGERLPPRRTSPPSSTSTRTLSCARSACCETKACSSFDAVAASPSSGRQSVARSCSARRSSSSSHVVQGYRLDELVEIIEDVGWRTCPGARASRHAQCAGMGVGGTLGGVPGRPSAARIIRMEYVHLGGAWIRGEPACARLRGPTAYRTPRPRTRGR